MTDHKFTDDEIIKALEVCTKSKSWGDCEDMGCPAATKHGCYFCLRTAEDYEGVAQDELLKDALALTNRQKAEIERLETVHADMIESLRLAAEANKDMQAELKKLGRDRYQILPDGRLELLPRTDINAIKAEAIKEFAERLKEKMYPYNGLDKRTYAINARAVEKANEDLVKEMMGNEKWN
jgi:hypothetical protein